MLKFDLNLQVQLGFFFGPLPDEITADQFERIGELLARPVDGAPQPRIIIKSRRFGEAISGTSARNAFDEAQISRVPALSWTGPGVRATWTPTRMDVYVDVKSIEDLTGVPLSVEQVVRRLATNMAAVAEQLSFPVNRAIVALQGEASCGDPVRVVARHFFAPTYNERCSDYLELLGRSNSRGSWTLANDKGGMDMPVNRIEQGEARWSLTVDGKIERPLAWMFDVNTAPDWSRSATIQASFLSAFYSEAARWIAARLEAIDV